MSNNPTPLFILGVGFIGGSLLQSLLESKKYTITALNRSDDKAKVLEKLGVKTLKGSLDSEDVIVKAVQENDIIIHAATADDEPSVKAILKGLALRLASAPAAVYIHTSGTGELIDDGSGLAPSPSIHSDLDHSTIYSLPKSAPHRNVDLLIESAVREKKVGKAKVAIIMPPLIYGVGTGPFNRTTIQIPSWIKDAVQHRQVRVFGKGASIWNNIHVSNLITAYETLLPHLLTSSPPTDIYFFAETSSHTWLSIAEELQSLLSSTPLSKELISHFPNEKYLIDPEKPILHLDEKSYMGSNSRSSADRLKGLGWRGGNNRETVWESVREELEEILKSDPKELLEGGFETH